MQILFRYNIIEMRLGARRVTLLSVASMQFRSSSLVTGDQFVRPRSDSSTIHTISHTFNFE